MTSLTDAQFGDLLAGFRESWFKFEAQPAYKITAERVPFQRFLDDGTLLPPGEFGWWQDWLTLVAGQVSQGKAIERVRVLDTPPTAYQRYLLAVSHWHTEAGERLQYIPRSRAAGLGLDRGYDWSLFDGAQVAITRFTAAGEVAGRELVTDPVAVRRYRALRALALGHAAPAADMAAA